MIPALCMYVCVCVCGLAGCVSSIGLFHRRLDPVILSKNPPEHASSRHSEYDRRPASLLISVLARRRRTVALFVDVAAAADRHGLHCVKSAPTCAASTSATASTVVGSSRQFSVAVRPTVSAVTTATTGNPQHVASADSIAFCFITVLFVAVRWRL